MTTPTAGATAPATPPDGPTIWRVDDPLWAEVRPRLVVDKPRTRPGAPRTDDRRIRDGPIWPARTGAQWEAWPRHRSGPKSTAHDRRKEWVACGCLRRARAHLLAAYEGEVGLRWEGQAADGCIGTAPLGKKQRSWLSRGAGNTVARGRWRGALVGEPRPPVPAGGSVGAAGR